MAEDHQSPQKTSTGAEALDETQGSATAARSLVLAFLLLLAVVPLWRGIEGLRRGSDGEGAGAPVTGPVSETETPAVTRPRQLLADLEADLERGSPLVDTLVPPVRWFLALLGKGTERTVSGHRGWLFFRPAVDHVTGPGFLDPLHHQRRRQSRDNLPPPQPDPLLALMDFSRQLSRRGIRLLLVSVPGKVTFYPGELTPRAAGTLARNPHDLPFQERLEREGVAVFDPTPVLVELRQETGQDLFLKTDTHWRPRAMEEVARRLAAVASGLLAPRTSRSPVYSRRRVVVSNSGDLARALQLPPWQTLYPAEEVEILTVLEQRDVGPRPWESDPTSQVLLLGDSFTNVYSRPHLGWGTGAGLAEQLSYHLGFPVDRIAVDAGGAFAARHQLQQELAAGSDRLREKGLVIYQFAARELSAGDWPLLGLSTEE